MAKRSRQANNKIQKQKKLQQQQRQQKLLQQQSSPAPPSSPPPRVSNEDDLDEALLQIVPEVNNRPFLRNAWLWYFAIATLILGSSLLLVYYNCSDLSKQEYDVAFKGGAIIAFVASISILFLAEEVRENLPNAPRRHY